MGGSIPSVKPKKPAPPLAVPDVRVEVGTQARKKLPRGRRDTFLTGDLVPEFAGKKFLG